MTRTPTFMFVLSVLSFAACGVPETPEPSSYASVHEARPDRRPPRQPTSGSGRGGTSNGGTGGGVPGSAGSGGGSQEDAGVPTEPLQENAAQKVWLAHDGAVKRATSLNEDVVEWSKGWLRAASQKAGFAVKVGTFSVSADGSTSFTASPSDRLVVVASNGFRAEFFDVQVTGKGFEKLKLSYGTSLAFRVAFGRSNMRVFQDHRSTKINGTYQMNDTLLTIDSVDLSQSSFSQNGSGGIDIFSEGETTATFEDEFKNASVYHSTRTSRFFGSPQQSTIFIETSTTVAGIDFKETIQAQTPPYGLTETTKVGVISRGKTLIGHTEERPLGNTEVMTYWVVLGDEEFEVK